MVHFSGKLVKEMGSFRATDTEVDGLIKSLYKSGDCDIVAFNGIWMRLQERYFGIKKVVEQPNQVYHKGFIEDINVICTTLEKIGLESKRWPEGPVTIKEYDEERLMIYFTTLAMNTNKLYRDHSVYMKDFGNRGTVMGKIRKSPGFLKKALMMLGFAAAVNTTTMESGINDAQKIERQKAITEWYSKTHVDIPDLGTIKVPDGYELYAVKDSALVTSYTPTGKGLMAGKNKDGTDYKETGKTSTGNDALKDFTGVATADIPKGAIVYIEGVGWKIADDSGGALRENAEKGITHVDVRTKKYADAIKWGKQHKKVYVFVKSGNHDPNISNYDKVLEARDMHKQGIDNFFKKM